MLNIEQRFHPKSKLPIFFNFLSFSSNDFQIKPPSPASIDLCICPKLPHDVVRA